MHTAANAAYHCKPLCECILNLEMLIILTAQLNVQVHNEPKYTSQSQISLPVFRHNSSVSPTFVLLNRDESSILHARTKSPFRSILSFTSYDFIVTIFIVERLHFYFVRILLLISYNFIMLKLFIVESLYSYCVRILIVDCPHFC